VDARPRDFYRGETQSPAARAPGTIPGAVNLPHHDALVERDGAYYLGASAQPSRSARASRSVTVRSGSMPQGSKGASGLRRTQAA